MIEWEKEIGAISLFVGDLSRSRAFYEKAFGLSALNEDDVSVMFRFKNTRVFLTKASAADEIIGPVPVAAPGSGASGEFAIIVADVDGVCAELAENGVTLLSGPSDRSWGMRTAIFTDPDGHVWEIAQEIGS
jgi:catechol 2,3-dioxygenase-like lactoylglutathione lyase family enzyme